MAEVWVVTGGIGSGKSTIRQHLEALGATTFDADRVGHLVLEQGGGAREAVVERWPEVVVDGRVDRAALGRIVFSDADALRELESMTHPAIGAELSRMIEASDGPVVFVEISVPRDLVDAGWLNTVVADLPDEERRARLRSRGMDPDDIERRMAAQPDRDAWRARGRWIIDTDGSRADVAERVDRLWAHVTGDDR